MTQQNNQTFRWSGIHYYHPPRYTNRLLVIGILGKCFYFPRHVTLRRNG